MSFANTFDSVVFSWHDPRIGRERTLDTSLRRGNIVIEDIRGVDDWTISRKLSADPETARQLVLSCSWEAVAFEIVGKIVDAEKQTDAVLRAWSKTSALVHMRVEGFEELERDFYVTAFECARYGNVRPFTLSCLDANGHIRGTAEKAYDLVSSTAMFELPFENLMGQRFELGYATVRTYVDLECGSFVEREPFKLTVVFADTASKFAVENDLGQRFTINYAFEAGDALTIDMMNSVFRLVRGGSPVSVLPYIDYAGSELFGIRQGAQRVSILDVSLEYGVIEFVEHLA